MRPQAIIPRIPLQDIIKDATITMTEMDAQDGNVSLLELAVICAIVRKVDPNLSFEIGTFDGRTTLNIAINQRPGTEVITLDLLSCDIKYLRLPIEDADKKYILKEDIGKRFKCVNTPALISKICGDSNKIKFSEFADRFDFVFVDGSHSYEYCCNDIGVAMQIANIKRSVILFHDYDTPHWPGVTKALNEFFSYGGKPDGFIRHIEDTSLVFYKLGVQF